MMTPAEEAACDLSDPTTWPISSGREKEPKAVQEGNLKKLERDLQEAVSTEVFASRGALYQRFLRDMHAHRPGTLTHEALKSLKG